MVEAFLQQVQNVAGDVMISKVAPEIVLWAAVIEALQQETKNVALKKRKQKERVPANVLQQGRQTSSPAIGIHQEVH